MSLTGFMAIQAKNAETFGKHPIFVSLVPLVDRMYDTAGLLASKKHSPTLVRLLMICRREFLAAASQIIRGLPLDSTQTRDEPWKQRKWRSQSREIAPTPKNGSRPTCDNDGGTHEGKDKSPNTCPRRDFRNWITNHSYAHLQQYFGIASDMYIHFTPDFFGRQTFTQTPQDDDVVFVELAYIADQREILFTGITMCSMHAHILLVFNAVFEQVMTDDPGWKLLKTTFDQMAADFLREVPPPPAPVGDSSAVIELASLCMSWNGRRQLSQSEICWRREADTVC